MTPLSMIAAGIISVLLGPTASESKPKSPTESKWARAIVDDFLDTFTSGQSELGIGLLSPELVQSFNSYYPRQGGAVAYLSSLGTRYPFSKASINSDEVAPDRSEVIVKGVLSGNDASFTFSIRVGKESASGKWSIRYIRIRPQ